MSADIDRGAIGKTDEVIPHGWRKATYTFTVEDDGDTPFMPRIHRAMIEHMAADPLGSLNEFVAGNGIRVHVSYPEVDYSNLPEPEPMRDYIMEELDADGKVVKKDTLHFYCAPVGHSLVLKECK